MGAIVFLLFSGMLGFALCYRLVPQLFRRVQCSLVSSTVSMSSLFLVLPASFFLGNLLGSWFVYLTSLALSGVTDNPLFYANAIYLLLCVPGLPLLFYALPLRKLLAGMKPNKRELLVILYILVYSSVLMIKSFFMKDGVLRIGLANAGDFEVHLSMLRSFSHMQNFPSDYILYAGEDLRYHFMFDFLAGNLEFLGLRVDLAMNIPSILSLSFLFFMLFSLGTSITGRRFGGALSVLFASMRSSWAFFTYLHSLSGNVWETLKANKNYIGATKLEDWGIYGPNVYVNQRHLCFGFGVALLVIYMFLPYFKNGFLLRKEWREQRRANKLSVREALRLWMNKECLAYDLSSIRCGILATCLLGLSVYFNGPAVICALLVLFVMALFSSHKIIYLVMAIATLCVTSITLNVFSSGTNTFLLQWKFGWALEDTKLPAILKHFELLFGIAILTTILYLMIANASKRVLLLAILAPFVFGFTTQMTADLNQNHKYMFFTILLIGIITANSILWLVTRVAKLQPLLIKVTGALWLLIIVVMLTVTGVYDYYLVLGKCGEEESWGLKEDKEFVSWVSENIDKDDVFISYDNYMTPITYAGVEVYLSKPVFPSSVGYNTSVRRSIEKQIFCATETELLQFYVKMSGADYLVLNDRVRVKLGEELNETLLRATYVTVFENVEGNFTILRLTEK